MAVENVTAAPPLTPKLIEAARPRERDYELRDPAAKGLVLRVSPKGAKIFRWYLTSERRVLTIGRWAKAPTPGHVTLAEARSWLEKLKAGHKAGTLADVEKQLRALRPARYATPADAAADGVVTVKSLADDFLKYSSAAAGGPSRRGAPLSRTSSRQSASAPPCRSRRATAAGSSKRWWSAGPLRRRASCSPS